MAPVDLSRNKDSMLKAHKEVSDPTSATNWALFGYEGQTDVLKFVEKGDGGISELIDELNSGRIMYAYLKILDPNTSLHKFVFVNWQPEGVPEIRKGACASHVRDVENFFRGAHVTINARSEDDIDEDLVKTKVAKASGANYSFHKEQRKPMPEITAVGSVYQKVKPQVEIKPDIREKFWEQTQKEEQSRINEEKQRRNSEKEKLDKETKEREEKAAKMREEREMERQRAVRSQRELESKADKDTQKQTTAWDPEDARREEEERARRAEEMRKQRAAEAKSLASGRTAGARAMFEQKPTSQFDQPAAKGPAPARKLKSSFLEEQENQAMPAARKQPIKLPGRDESTAAAPVTPPPAASSRQQQPVTPPAASSRQQQPVAPPPTVTPATQQEEEEEELYDDGGSYKKQQEPAAADDEDDIYDDADPVKAAATVTPAAGPTTRNLLSEGLPRRPPGSDDEEHDDEDQDWDDSAPAKVIQTNVPAAVETAVEQLTISGGQQQQQQLSAQALYDYQAAEDNEITFDPGDVITDIEMIDEGWWVGTAPSGQRGMFPANYVELIQ